MGEGDCCLYAIGRWDWGPQVSTGPATAQELDVIGWRHVAIGNDAASLRQRVDTCRPGYLY